MTDPEQAVKEGLNALELGKKHGVPISLFVIILLFAVYAASWGTDKERRIENLERNNQALSEDVEKIKAGKTVYQEWQADTIRRISESVGAGTPPPIPRTTPRTFPHQPRSSTGGGSSQPQPGPTGLSEVNR